MTTERWRLLPYDVGSSSLHFALSDALVRYAAVPTVWWHSTDRPTLILGTGQPWAHVARDEVSAEDVLVIKRHAGGTAVFASSGVVGMDVVLPIWHHRAQKDVVETYRFLGETWEQATRSLGAASRLVSIEEVRAQTRSENSWSRTVRLACFGSLSPYEVAVGAKKLVGLAQVRRRSGILLQAGIHLNFEPFRLAQMLRPNEATELAASLQAAAVGLHAVTARKWEIGDVIQAVHRSLGERLGVVLEPGEWTEEEVTHARHWEKNLISPDAPEEQSP